MPLNRNILRATLTRDIPISELLEKLRKITATGEEKMAQLDKLAKEIEETYPLRKTEE